MEFYVKVLRILKRILKRNVTIRLEVVNIWILAWAGLARSNVFRQNTASHWNFLYLAQIPHSPVLVVSIQSKTRSSFLSSLAEWVQNTNFITSTGSWLDGLQLHPIGLYFVWKILFTNLSQTSFNLKLQLLFVKVA